MGKCMRVLLLHPEDLPLGGPWSRERWDLVIDLGFAGPETYADWERILKCRVLSLHQFAGQTASYRWVNQVFERGRGELLDRKGLDWWEILAVGSYQDLHELYLFRQLQQEICASRVEFLASRPNRSSRIAEQVFGVRVRYFVREPQTVQRILRPLRSARNLRLAQIVEIAFDKWDPKYQLRRHVARRERTNLADPCILLPSAYSNVTRSVLGYAARLPHRNFLLIVTRPNAAPDSAPANVAVGSLAEYVEAEKTIQREGDELQEGWRAFSDRMQSEDEQFRCAASAGVWDYFPARLLHGLLLREAWSSVLQRQRVIGVLCGDDLNYHTRLPLILAQRVGLTAVYCSHGALDSGFFFKKPYADWFLVKGDMERDYLERAAAIEPERIYVGAAGDRGLFLTASRIDNAIVFFSQPYEVMAGRADSIYREIIPRLRKVAHASRRKLIIKLHPFESRRGRKGLLSSILPGIRSGEIEIFDGTPPAQVMSRAWCGVTVDSSVAVECAINGIPFFLCGWLDLTGDGYLQQYSRFGVAQILNTPDDIERIPRMVSEFRPDPDKLYQIWREANPTHVDEILFGMRPALRPCAT